MWHPPPERRVGEGRSILLTVDQVVQGNRNRKRITVEFDGILVVYSGCSENSDFLKIRNIKKLCDETLNVILQHLRTIKKQFRPACFV